MLEYQVFVFESLWYGRRNHTVTYVLLSKFEYFERLRKNERELFFIDKIRIISAQLDCPSTKENQAPHLFKSVKYWKLNEAIASKIWIKSKQMKINDVFDLFSSKAWNTAILSRIFHLPYSRENKQCLFKTHAVFGHAYFRAFSKFILYFCQFQCIQGMFMDQIFL